MVDKIVDIIKREVILTNNSNGINDNNYQLKLKKYIKYLENDIGLDDYEFKELFTIISSLNSLSNFEKKDILSKLGLYYWMQHDHSKEEIEYVDENNEFLDIDDIENLWRDFGFSEEFIEKLETDKMYKKDFINLTKYSTLEKIKRILDLLKENGIVSDDFKNREKQFLQILIHSDENVIKTLFECINEDIVNVGLSLNNKSFNKRFCDYLGHVSLFGGGTRVYKKRDKKTPRKSGPSPSKADFVGTFSKYISNREFLKKMGVLIKPDSLSTLEKSTNIVKSNYFLLKKYGFENKDIESSFSVLSAPNLENNLDLAIELRILDRFKKNPTHLVTFSEFIAMRIKYCREKNISVDGRNSGELATKIVKKSCIFDAEKNGPETHLKDKSDNEITYNPKGTTMISDYKKLIGIVNSTPLLVNMIESDVDIDDINDIEYDYSYRKQYFKSILDEFDQRFSIDQYQYAFGNGYEKVIISRLKVKKSLVRLLYNEFVDCVHNSSFNYISNILIYCIEKKSYLTRNEHEIIESSVYEFIDEFNKKKEDSRIASGFIDSEYNSSNYTIDTYRRK